MEGPKSKQEEMKNALTVKTTTGVGGIGAIIFLGGALVAATLVSAFEFKRRTSRRTEQQPKSSPENDVTVVTDLSNDLEMMMKSSKDDHHSQIIKGLTFLLPADSSLPFLPKNSSIDAAAETGVTRNEPTQVLILNDEKAKIKVDGTGNQETVFPQIHEESTPLFDESGITITKEECLFSVSEASSLEPLIKNIDNSMGSNQQTICSDGLVPESNGFHNCGLKSKLSSPLVDTPLHSESESTKEDECYSTEKLSDFVEAVELPVEEDCEVKSSLPLLDSKLLSESESANKDDLSKENSPVSVEAVKLLEEEEGREGKSPLPLMISAMVFQSESSLPLFDSAKPETPLVSDKAFELLQEDSEANNVGTGYRDHIEVEKELGIHDAMVQEMVEEDVILEIAQEHQVTDDKETLENHDKENIDSEPLVEAIELMKEGETFDEARESIGVGEDKEEEFPLIEEEEELEEENGNEIVGADQIIAEVNEEVKLIGKGEKDDEFGETHGQECKQASVEALLDQIAEEEEQVEVSGDEKTVSNSVLQSDKLGMCPLTEEYLDLSEAAIEVVSLDTIKVDDQIAEEEEQVEVSGDEKTVSNSVLQSDKLGMCPLTEEYLDLSEAAIEVVSLDTIKVDDQIAEEEEQVEVSGDEKTVSNSVLQSDKLGMCPLTEEYLDLSEAAIEVVSLDTIKVDDGADMRLIEEESEERDDVQGDIVATKCEVESMEETADAEEVFEDKKEEFDGDIIEDELMEQTDDVDELVKSLDNETRSLITTEQEFSDPMMDDCLVLDTRKVPISMEDEYQQIQTTEEATIVDHVVEKTPQVELTEEEDSDGEEEESEDEDEDEESSEGKEDLLTESNYDAVWPAESIQDLSFKLNQIKTNNQEMQGESDNDNEVETIRTYVKEVENQHIMEPWKVNSWMLSTLAMIWCLCYWYFDLPYEKVSIIALAISIAILFGFPNHLLAKKHK